MRKSRIKSRDPLPEHFSSIEEAGEFWDSHSSADYEEYMRDAHFDVDLKRNVHEVRITNQLLREVRRIARRQGVSAETLVNLWLHEKIVTSVEQVDEFEHNPISPMRNGSHRAISFDEDE